MYFDSHSRKVTYSEIDEIIARLRLLKDFTDENMEQAVDVLAKTKHLLDSINDNLDYFNDCLAKLDNN